MKKENFEDSSSYEARLAVIDIFDKYIKRNPTPKEITRYSSYETKDKILKNVEIDFPEEVAISKRELEIAKNKENENGKGKVKPSLKDEMKNNIKKIKEKSENGNMTLQQQLDQTVAEEEEVDEETDYDTDDDISDPESDIDEGFTDNQLDVLDQSSLNESISVNVGHMRQMRTHLDQTVNVLNQIISKALVIK
jgi:hypothetical protein